MQYTTELVQATLQATKDLVQARKHLMQVLAIIYKQNTTKLVSGAL